jgi:predicted DNA-binding transcriptional regulator
MDSGQLIQNNLWVELLKLAIFAVFVTSIIEVVKGISAIGLKGIVVDLYKTLVHNSDMRPECIQTLNFMIALICCYAFDYGIIANLVQTGEHIRKGLAGWIDYIGTASLVYTGADSLFRKFASMRDSWQAAKKPAGG